MAASVYLLLGAAIAYLIFVRINGLRVNLAAARKSGLPYIVIPWNPYSPLWQLMHRPVIYLMKTLLPRRLWKDWIFVMRPDWGYHDLQEPWQRLGETFMIVGPSKITMLTQNADAIHQIMAKREIFPKPSHNYKILALFGDNVLTAEGAMWRLHRKTTSASFNERNAAHTFAEAIRQTQGMLQTWCARGPGAIKTLEEDAMTLALNIIGYVGFGLRFVWPGQSLPENLDPKLKKYGSTTPPEGHSLTFPQSLATVLHYIFVMLVVPKPLLRLLPFKWAKATVEARANYEQYMQEFLREKKEEVRQGDRGEGGMDIMGQLVRSKYGSGDKNTATVETLKDSDIVGNAFIIIVAGHETTANTLHFTLLELANNPAAQRALQADIDRIFPRDSDPREWNYEQNVNAMLASRLGASMNETLRLMPAVVSIPKWTTQEQILHIDGEKHVLPAKLVIHLSAVGAHRNPRNWPTQPSKVTGEASDLNDFDPERWYRASGASASASDKGHVEDTEDYGGFSGPDTSAALFRPVRGSFVPFSDGPRSCLGRRIAQVEMIAALAVLFQRYSLELDVSAWATDEEVAAMSRVERAKVYQQAQAQSRATIRAARSVLTLKLHGSSFVPVRLVPRGEERFVDFMD